MNHYTKIRWMKGKVSFLLHKRAWRTLLWMSFTAFIIFIASIALGDMTIHPLTVLQVFVGGGTDMEQLVIKEFRLPRIVMAILVGMCLAVAGGILQGIIRNPLASPDIIGVTGGAAVGAVGFLVLFSNDFNALTVSIQWMPLAAFLGAAAVALLVYFLSWKNGVSPIRLVLIGIGISALMQAFTTIMMISGPIYRASQANLWITGTLHGTNWSNVWTLAPIALLFIIVAFSLSRSLNVQELGDDVALGVGSAVGKQRFILLLLSTALVGGAVAFAGGIGFVGLMAPHMARRLVGSSFGALLPVAAIIGAILVMLADVVGRIALAPLEIPAGVFTAGIGAPYFIYLLFKTRNA